MKKDTTNHMEKMEDTFKSCIRDHSIKNKQKVIEGNLVMESNMFFDCDLIVKGSIIGKDGKWQDLTVNGDLFVNNGNIMAGIVEVWGDMTANNVSAWKLSARNAVVHCIETEREVNVDNISAFSLVCNGLNLKKGGDLLAHVVITDRDSREMKNWGLGKEKCAYVS